MLADFLQNLALGHLVGGFNLIDSKIEPVSFQPVLELTFRLTRSKQQNGAGWLEAGKDFVLVEFDFTFADTKEDKAREEFGELGPAEETAGASSGGGRGGSGGGDRRGGRGGRGRRPRR